MNVPKRRDGKVKPAAKIIITAAFALLFVYIIVKTDFSSTIDYIKALPFYVIFILIFLQLVTQFTLNFQWYRLCSVLNLKPSFSKLLVINSYGMVADAVTPGEKVGGEVARVVQLNRMLGFNTNQSTSVVTIQKALSLTALVFLNIIAVITLSGQIEFLKPPVTRIVLTVSLVVLGGFFVYLLIFTSRLNSSVQKIKRNGKIVRLLKNWMENFTRDTEAISRNPKELIFQLLLSFGIWALFPIKLVILVSQYGDVSLIVLFAATFVSYFAAMLPIFPGGLGTFEGAMSGILILYGLTFGESMAISLIFRFVTFWFVVLFSVAVIVGWKIYEFIRKSADMYEK